MVDMNISEYLLAHTIFQRVMDIIFRGLQFFFCLLYMKSFNDCVKQFKIRAWQVGTSQERDRIFGSYSSPWRGEAQYRKNKSHNGLLPPKTTRQIKITTHYYNIPTWLEELQLLLTEGPFLMPQNPLRISRKIIVLSKKIY